MDKNEMKRISLYLPQEIIDLCESDIDIANAKSRNQFIAKAVKFYDCYLHKELISEILAPTIESAVGAKIDLSEYKLSRIIFKLAVEISSLMNILAGAFELDDQKVRKMKHRVINEVKELNGWINLEDIIRYQNGEE